MQVLIGWYSRIYLMLVQAPGLGHQSAYAVAVHRTAKFLFGNRKAYPCGGYLGIARHHFADKFYRKNRKRFPCPEKRINMLLALEPLVCFESITNGETVLKIISDGFHLTQSVYDGLFCGAKPILYGRLPFAYAYGNHELSYGGGGAVEMYVSYSIIFCPFTRGLLLQGVQR